MIANLIHKSERVVIEGSSYFVIAPIHNTASLYAASFFSPPAAACGPSSSSFRIRSLTSINAFPSKFNPQCFLLAPAFFAPNPTPHIRSRGLASTSSLSPVDKSSSLSCEFWVNFR
ncbi:hypothetical protein I7I50_10617 [Histoplasma capsulatum G186AR]|uniref:Uncharacterized protein n=1 Tax=Ajellomyces capsulatus TaxID=5037 RepID=A0A8H7Z9K7_AJECA|nr:hypothetical protein I7I52_01855 [Histoplasma capsulatum]QSS69347.1 hypothetical protein I7I50_10617 [Histoplasma capsulatum G186AR]